MKKINLYIDGNYFYKLWNFMTYEHLPFQYILDWEQFKRYLISYISTQSGTDIDELIIEKSSLFLSKQQSEIYEETFFSNLTDANIDFFFCSESVNQTLGNQYSQITTATTWQACKNYYKDPYDYIVLISGFESYIPMIDGLKREGVKSLIVYLDDFTSNSAPLLRRSDWILDIEYIFNEKINKDINSIFARRILTKEESELIKQKMGIPLKKPEEENLDYLETDKTKEVRSSNISFDQLKLAINNTRIESNGFVLVALLKISLEKVVGKQLSEKMKNILAKYTDKLEITYKPAFSVKLKEYIND